MENQHKHIKGYRDLSQEEIALMNEVKNKAAEVGALVETLEKGCKGSRPDRRKVDRDRQDRPAKGFMALVRSVASDSF
ncbi:MAG: hypothetical protein M5R42_16745 [Rhodocyclaceae bacterium]|nr:hypothetical protein [Rhodocyclaceae bacterium]